MLVKSASFITFNECVDAKVLKVGHQSWLQGKTWDWNGVLARGRTLRRLGNTLRHKRASESVLHNCKIHWELPHPVMVWTSISSPSVGTSYQAQGSTQLSTHRLYGEVDFIFQQDLSSLSDQSPTGSLWIILKMKIWETRTSTGEELKADVGATWESSSARPCPHTSLLQAWAKKEPSVPHVTSWHIKLLKKMLINKCKLNVQWPKEY